MDPESVRRRKYRLRAACLNRRRRLSPELVRGAAAAVCLRVLDLPEFAAARLLHVYLASLENELATAAILTAGWAHGKQIAVPVVRPGSRVLAHAVLSPQEALTRDRWGLLGPSRPGSCPLVELSRIDLVLVPGLAFDRGGRRLGMGGGYYDRFLAAVAAPLVGLTYDELLLARVPEEPHDVRMDAVVCPQGLIRCGDG